MKQQKRILIGVAFLAVGLIGYGAYRLGVSQGAQRAALEAPLDHTAKVRGAERPVLYWHDPMVPGQKFDQPGKSPFMDMQLVPVYGGGEADEGEVSISPRVQQNLGIRTAQVSRSEFSTALSAVGSVAYNEREVALVQARSNGFVERLLVRAPLDTVRKGQVLAELYMPDWVAAQEEYLSAARMAGSGTEELAAGARQRMRLAGMSEEQIRQVAASGKVHARIAVIAPTGGVVSELVAREGMTVAAGAPLFRINGVDSVWVNAEVPEYAAAQVRPGTLVEASTPSLPGIVFKGKVGALLPEVNPTTRTLKARIELANPSAQLVPGMFATIRFAPAARKDVLLVPSEAVIQTGTRHVVMRAQGEGRFAPVDVEVGAEVDGQTEILKGLEAGQQVVVSGQFLIDSEASLKGTATRMSDGPAPPAADQNAPVHHGSGKVERIDADEITISHGPIPSLQWRSMTMGFKPPPGGLPPNVAAGDTVSFDVHARQDGAYQITSITPTTGDGKKPAAPGAAQ